MAEVAVPSSSSQRKLNSDSSNRPSDGSARRRKLTGCKVSAAPTKSPEAGLDVEILWVTLAPVIEPSD